MGEASGEQHAEAIIVDVTEFASDAFDFLGMLVHFGTSCLVGLGPNVTVRTVVRAVNWPSATFDLPGPAQVGPAVGVGRGSIGACVKPLVREIVLGQS
jgi:hypothetical protein